jgi:hypothetical protein
MVDSGTLVGLLIWIIIIGSICGLLWWLVGFVGLPEPFNKVARIAIAIVAVLLLINFLLGLGGQPVVRIR